jgi:hypothetical protein
VKIIQQCLWNPETNLLDLGIWMSIQVVERTTYMHWDGIQAIAYAVSDAWDSTQVLDFF